MIIGMVFHRRQSLLVCPRHVQVTVSRSRGIHCPLRSAMQSNTPAALRSRLRRDREETARLRGAHLVVTTGYSEMNVTTSAWPFSDANSAALLPALSSTLTSAPRRSNSFTRDAHVATRHAIQSSRSCPQHAQSLHGRLQDGRSRRSHSLPPDNRDKQSI
jgi:hypothetical protein